LEFHSARIFQRSSNDFKKPKIKILAVNSKQYKVPPWNDFKRVIREAFTEKKNEKEIDIIITTLENKVKGGGGLTREANRCLKNFRRIVDDELKVFTLRMHCEAVFAALLDARKRTTSSGNDIDLKALFEFSKVWSCVSM
jgi:hypothetical protein